MSDNSSAGSFGFNTKPADNDSQRAALSQELQFAKGFTLLFALCNDAIERDRQIATLRKENPGIRIQEIPIRREVYHLRDILRTVLDDPVPDLVCVYGMENWVRSDSPARTVPFLLNLNAGRNHFYIDCPCPILFWVPEYLYALIAETAPDFVSVRSGMYVFASPPAANQEMIHGAQSLDYYNSYALTPEERETQLEETKNLLAKIRSLPEERRDTMDEARTLDNLAMLYAPQEKYYDAEALLNEALAIKERVMGRAHPETARTMRNLAILYILQQRYDEAEPLLKEALAIYSNAVGREHADTLTAMQNLAIIYRLQDRYGEAELLLEEILAIRQRLLGSVNMSTASTMQNLAIILAGQGRYDEAEPLFKEALTIYERLKSRNHPSTAVVLINLAQMYADQGKYADGGTLASEALAIILQFLPLTHPDVVAMMRTLGAIKRLQGVDSP